MKINLDVASRELAVATMKRPTPFSAAMADLGAGLSLWRLWLMLGWNDILQRYRRSILGPFWLTASMAIMVVMLGILYAQLFRLSVNDFLPSICVGLLVWYLLSSFLIEGGTLLIGSESYINQIKLPYSVYAFRSTWSKIIIFGHNIIIYFAVLLYFEIWPGAVALMAIPGLLIVVFNGLLANLFIGMISARFRDVPQVIASVVQIIFFVTPIFWKPELVKGRQYITDLNPFFHLIEIVRAPLLGSMPSTTTFVAVALITVVNLAISGTFFVRFRARIAYWV